MSWTAGKVKDWSDPKYLRFAPSYDVFLALSEACNERLFVNGSSIFLDVKKLDQLHAANKVYRLAAFIDNAVYNELAKNSVSNWIDFTDNGGVFDKLDRHPNAWTEQSLKDYLGIDDYIRLGREKDGTGAASYFKLAPIFAEWVEQTYRVLNCFIWRKAGWADLRNPFEDPYYRKISTGATYNDAKATWPDDWSSLTDVIAGDYMFSDGTGGNVTLRRDYIQNHQFTAVVPDNQVCEADLYCFPTIPSGINEFWSDRNNWEEDKYNLFHTYTDVTDGAKVFDFREFISGVPQNPGITSRGWYVDQRQLAGEPLSFTILRHDVTGGFNYVSL